MYDKMSKIVRIPVCPIVKRIHPTFSSEDMVIVEHSIDKCLFIEHPCRLSYIYVCILWFPCHNGFKYLSYYKFFFRRSSETCHQRSVSLLSNVRILHYHSLLVAHCLFICSKGIELIIHPFSPHLISPQLYFTGTTMFPLKSTSPYFSPIFTCRWLSSKEPILS